MPSSNFAQSCILAATAATLGAQAAPPGFDTPDHDIRIGVLPGQLRYDKERFSVKPSSKVKLTLANTDSMQHNLLILRKGDGVRTRVAAAAQALGATASEKQFVPDSSDVLFHTKAIFLDQSDTIWFRAPKEPGDYPYICTLPGHTFTMFGVMRVGDAVDAGEEGPLTNLSYRMYLGKWKKLPNFDRLEPDRRGSLADGLLDLYPMERVSNYGTRFTGDLTLKKAGSYTFFLNSDDGSRLLIDGKNVVEYDGLHGPAEEQRGSIELDARRYVLCVDYFQGTGGQALKVAYEGPGLKRRSLSASPKSKARMTPIAVHHHPVVKRVHVEGAAARTIAVGLPGGMNYCFDADQCCVQFGWAGAYLDVGPDRDGRGGKPCKTLGKRFAVGSVGFPLREPDGRQPAAKFVGYRTHGAPRLSIDWGGQELTWTITAAPGGIGLHYEFQLPDRSKPMQFTIDPDGLQLASSAGSWQQGVLTLPASDAKKFTVTLTAQPEGGK